MSSRFALLLALAASLGAQPGLSPIQIVSLRGVSGPMVSPDGTQVAFYRSAPRLAGDPPGSDYRHLCIMPRSGGPGDVRVLMGGKKRVSGAAFSPDGTMITFLHKGEADTHREVYGLPLDGGEPVRITSTAHGVSSYKWGPKGKWIAYTYLAPRSGDQGKARAAGFKQEIYDEDWRPIRLGLWNVESRRTRNLSIPQSVTAYEWCPDGTKLALGLAPRNLVDDSYMFVRLHQVNVATGMVTSLVDNPGKLGSFALSGDGKQLAYISAQDKRDPHAGMLYVLDTETGETNPVVEDSFKGMFHQALWKGNDLRGVVSIGVSTRSFSWSPTGRLKVDEKDLGIAFRSVVPVKGSEDLICAASTPRHPEELYELGSEGPRRMTDSNPWLQDVPLGRQTVETVRGKDDVPIEGLLIHPISRRGGVRAPLVIVVHGGPESHFSNGWLTSYGNWGQILAARGYYVWYPNYRASTGYGTAFAKADHGDPMGGEFRDHLNAIDEFVERGLVDRDRVGIGGGSYGGYTAAWAATSGSEHFAAAVSFVPFVDIRTKWYTSDIPNEFYLVHYEEKWPHQQPDFLRWRSPLSFADKCKTPLLLLGGTADPRVHPSQPHMLYRAVKTSTETPVRYVRYPGEGHGNRVNVYRYDYLIRTLRWLEYYLRPGNHRSDPPPPYDLDYSEWLKTGS